MKVTLKEIAEIAGVHRSTVDKVIHGRVGVSDEVRQRIQKILDELGYEPNMVGRALQKQHELFRFAAVLLKVDALDDIQNGIDQALKHYNNFKIELNYYIVNFLSAQEQADIIERLIEEGVQGLIVSPIQSDIVKAAIDKACDSGIIVITTNFDIENSKRACYVGQNGVKAGRIAGRLMGEFLRGQGEVAVISGRKQHELQISVANRERSFIEMIRQTYPEIKLLEPIAVYDDPKIILQEALNLLKTHPFIKGIYITGGGVKEVGKAIKLSTPKEKIDVICFERYPEIVSLMKENLITCTIASDLYNQGYLPVKLLVDHLIYGKPCTKRHVFTNIDILVKESVLDD